MLSFQQQQLTLDSGPEAGKNRLLQCVAPNLARPLPCNQREQACRASSLAAAVAPARQAGPSTDVPDYSDIDSQPLNKVVMALFRNKMVAAIGSDSQLSG